MAHMIPPAVHPDCVSNGEKEMFRRLRDDPGTQDWTVMHSLFVADHPSQLAGEIDFLVVIPGRGVLGLEIKGCSKMKRTDGRWYYGADSQGSSRSPFQQASVATHEVRRKVSRERPSLRGVPFWHAVVFTHMSFDEESTEWHDWEVIDGRVLREFSIADLLLRVIGQARNLIRSKPTGRWLEPGMVCPTDIECEELIACLRPDFELPYRAQDRAELREAELQRFTTTQFRALDAMASNERVFFEGPAGCGKTLLAQEATRRAALQGRQTLFVCFNKLLGDWLEAHTTPLAPGSTVMNIHRFMLGLAQCEVQPEPTFWTHDLPWLAIEKHWELGDEAPVFEELVVDEAQDLLRPEYIDFLDQVLAGGLSAGRWRMFGDFERQAIYGSDTLTLDEFRQRQRTPALVFSLRENCRNTPRVADWAQALSGLQPAFAAVLRPDDDISPKLVYYENQEEQIRLVAETLEREIEIATPLQDIVVLSMKNDEKSVAGILQNRGWSRILAPAATSSEQNIRFSSVHAFKGLEAPVVIVTDIDDVTREMDRSLLYIALTRSTGRLLVFANSKTRADIVATVLAREPALNETSPANVS